MGKWKPLNNIKVRLTQHPPSVIFFLCVLSLAAAFASFGLFIRYHTVRNPDVPQDWNQILSSLAKLHFCLFTNETQPASLDPQDPVDISPLLVSHDPADAYHANSSGKALGSVNLSMMVPLRLTYCGHEDQIASVIFTTVRGILLGMKGPAGKEFLNITMHFFPRGKLNNNTGADAACLVLSTPAPILPQSIHPPVCPVSLEQDSETHTVSAVTSDWKPMSPDLDQECYSLHYTPDPNLTVMLTQEEQDLVEGHLMIISVFLLSICAVLCLVGSLSYSKSRSGYTDGFDLKEPLMNY